MIWLLLIIIIVGTLLAYVLSLVIKFRRFVAANKQAAKITRPYFKHSKTAKQHLLVLGDSTMYGAGIKDQTNTMGGKYPDASVETLAANGARVMDILYQAQSAQYGHYDVVLVGVGGNDVVRFSSYKQLKDDLKQTLDVLSQKANKVILFHSVNVGNIGFFTFPLNHLFDYRSRQLSKAYSSVSADYKNVTYLNFYRPIKDDYYNKNSRPQFLADDGFHPSDYANQYFFKIISKKL